MKKKLTTTLVVIFLPNIAKTAIGFSNGMVYYGMPLAMGALAFNLYLSVTLNALTISEAPIVTFIKMNLRIYYTMEKIFCLCCNVQQCICMIAIICITASIL